MSVLKGYSFTQIRLHWVVAVLIVFQLIFGEDMGGAWDAVEDGIAPVMSVWVWAHIVAGIAVLVFALWRLTLRMTRGAPDAPHSDSVLMTKAADYGHWLLYVLMVVTPLSGLAAWYGGIDTAAEVHELMKPAIIVLVVGHVLAALYHQFWLKDGLLLRMKRPLD